jgi:hypothetical protein
MRRVLLDHRALGHPPHTALFFFFCTGGRRPIADTGTAKSGPAQATAQAKWPFLALCGHSLLPAPLVRVPVSAPQFPTHQAIPMH